MIDKEGLEQREGKYWRDLSFQLEIVARGEFLCVRLRKFKAVYPKLCGRALLKILKLCLAQEQFTFDVKTPQRTKPLVIEIHDLSFKKFVEHV